MKTIFLVGMLALSLAGFAQTKIEKTIPVKAGDKLIMIFEDPKLIKLQTWDKDEVLIKGVVSINRGENDDAFELQIAQSGDELRVTSVLRDKENIPQRIVIKKGDTEYYFKAKNYQDPEVRKFLTDNGPDYTYMSNGIIKDIQLEVFVPANMATDIDSKFGLVEVKNFQAPLRVSSKFGGIDATIAAHSIGELVARTNFGEILTNLDIKFDGNYPAEDHWTAVSAKLGNGPRYDLESKFGKVYLRKPEN